MLMPEGKRNSIRAIWLALKSLVVDREAILFVPEDLSNGFGATLNT